MPSLALHARAALDDAIAHLSRADVTAKNIHEARKRLKELRAIARLCAGCKPLRMSLRDIGRRLSSSRDAEAIVESFDKLRERFGERRFEKIRHALVQRQGPTVNVSAALSSLRRLRSRIATLDPGKTLDDGLVKAYRKARRAMRTAATTRDAADFHEWRKRVKDHWYQMQFIGADAGALHDLSRILGDHHDLVVLRETLRNSDVASPRLLRELDSLIAVRMTDLEREAEILGSRVFDEKPRAWLRRLTTRRRFSRPTDQSPDTSSRTTRRPR